MSADENKPFRVGDVVRLKSGGPCMVVTEINDGGVRKPSSADENNPFRAGDVVQLKSGGSYMVIQEINDGVANCTWFDKDKELQDARVPTAALRFPLM